MFPVHTILHPTDYTEQSRYALHLACALARDYGAHLVLLHVAPLQLPPFVNAGVFPVPYETPRAVLEQDLAKIEIPDPTLAVERIVAEGDPASEILRVAEERHVDLIVMGTHGRRGLGRALMGSVAEHVVRRSSCPVLTIRTPLGVSDTTPTQEAVAARD